jgi:TonB-dependent starch-binding outer membrane protein SusC
MLMHSLISGTVTDARTGKPMVGVNIVVQYTISGTTTDAAGKFILPVKQVPVYLVFSYVGYQPYEQQVTLPNRYRYSYTSR